MSPVAYSRTAVVPSGNAMAPGASHVGGIAKNVVGGDAFGGTSGPGKAPFRHVDDLVSVSIDLDPHTPLRKILEIGDMHMRQASTFNDFRRPDLALQEYIRASIIAVDKVPRHKDYPSMRSDRSDLNRLYNALKAKINDNEPTFAKIKEDIKEDNLRSGVQPAKSTASSSESALMDLPSPPSTTPLQTQSGGGTANGHVNGSSRKPKPTIHPKPQGLHGKFVKPDLSKMPEDLAARFAKLRNSHESRNRPADASKPAGPRDIPIAHRSRPSVDSSMPSMPKLPDAIYSPARGTVTSEVANLPSSTPRGMFSRTNSIASAPSASARTSMENAIRSFNGEQFVTAHTYGEPPLTPQHTGITIPKGDTITVSELVDYMQKGSTKIQVLLIDVRDRESFDEGHIMSQSTICVEPEVLSRESISADDIADSMVLAPPKEKLSIEQRDRVDLVVIYDQDSTSLPAKITGNTQEMILYNIRQALSHYSYSRPLKNPPKLLVGGLDAWVDKLGAQSLETSNTMATTGAANGLAARANARRQRNKTRTLDRKEVEQFEQIIKEGQEAASNFDYTRSREEFDRRFPSVTNMPESMSSTTQPSGPSGGITESEEENFLIGLAPKPPSRPKPAVPRTRYSGLESNEDSNASAIAMVATATPAISRERTGLYNPGNWCYANSALQSLIASVGFVDEMLDQNWPTNDRPTAAPNSPQLMSKIIGNIFQWMSKRQFEVMKVSTLMHYLRSIHAGFPSDTGTNQIIRFGDQNQHDSDEFIQFIFEQLHTETNRPKPLPYTWPQKATSNVNVVEIISNAWRCHIAQNYSIIDRHWTMMILNQLTCQKCGSKNFAMDVPTRLGVTVDTSGTGSLENYLRQTFGATQTRESQCDACKHPTKFSQSGFARLPPLLCVQLGRTAYNGDTAVKNKAPFAFPFDNLDLGPYCPPAGVRQAAQADLSSYASNMENAASLDYASIEEGIGGTALYDLYAVVTHNGPSPRSGHYWNFVRAGPNKWVRCNDSKITVDSKNQVSAEKVRAEMVQCSGGGTPVLLFYKRQNQAWNWQ
ncbi:hypothetical protein F5X99DRAFT_370676 [Biscogniauxia marginata]|nr:hypothetical protein F5X99DRAFT_370676 [Biscogniauxia marginata]